MTAPPAEPPRAEPPDSEPTPADPVSIDEVGRGRTLPWIAALGGLVLVGLALSALFGNRGDDNDETADGTTPSPTTVAQPEAATEPEPVVGPTPTAAPTTIAAPLPESVSGFEPFAEAIWLYGYGPGFDFARIDITTGSIQWLLPGEGDAFIPLATDGEGLMGAARTTGVFFVLGTDGLLTAVDFDVEDAPLFYPRAGGSGYLRHGTWTGALDYLDSTGKEVLAGTPVQRGFDVIADTDLGPLLRGLDGRARIVDIETGETAVLLDGLAHTAAGDRVVLTRCTAAASCQVVVEGLDGSNSIATAIDPELAHRTLVGLSPDGRWMMWRAGGALNVLDTDSGETVRRFPGYVSADVIWLDGEVAAIWDVSSRVTLWRPADDGGVEVDLSGVFVHDDLGVWPVRAGS